MNSVAKTHRNAQYPHVAIGLISLVVMAVLAKYFLEYGMAWRCASMVVLGMPCPTCGSTRALAALAEFDVASALRLNPLLVIALVGLVSIGFMRVVPAWVRKFGWHIAVAAVLLNWLYLLLFLPR